jgi:hypothetical protein
MTNQMDIPVIKNNDVHAVDLTADFYAAVNGREAG